MFKYSGSTANINNFKFITGGKKRISFTNQSAKNIILFIGIHEFQYKQKILDEVYRVLRDTGKLYLLETVYKDTIEKDKNCGFTYLFQKNCID